MLSLVYVSSATEKFEETDLVPILKASRENNTRLDVTGMLLYKDGNFIQVLEGPDDAVRQLYTKIGKDDRHQGVISLLDKTVDERHFPDWSMGFRNLNDPDLRELGGYNEFMNAPLTAESLRRDPNRARRLLHVFRRNMELK